MGRRKRRRQKREDRIERYHQHVEAEFSRYASAHPNASQDEIRDNVAKTLEKEYGNAWVALFMPFLLKLIEQLFKNKT